MKATHLYHHHEGLVVVLPAANSSVSIRDAFSLMKEHKSGAIVRRESTGYSLIEASVLASDRNKSAKTLGGIVGGRRIVSPAKKLASLFDDAALKVGEDLHRKSIDKMPGNLILGGLSSQAVTVIAKSAKDAVWIHPHYSFCRNCKRVVKTGDECCTSQKPVKVTTKVKKN